MTTIGKEVTLNILETMTTHGFRAVMSIIWIPVILIGTPVVIMLKRSKIKR